MSWLTMHLSILGIDIFWPALLFLGISVGLCTRVCGINGSWMLAPGLHLLGMPMMFAVGTSAAHGAGCTIATAMQRGSFGTIDAKLVLMLLPGTLLGYEAGARLLMGLERLGIAGTTIFILYSLLLFFLAWLVLSEVHRLRTELPAKETLSATPNDFPDTPSDVVPNTSPDIASNIIIDATLGKAFSKLFFAARYKALFAAFSLSPRITCRASQQTFSLWLPLTVAFITGWLAGLLGVGPSLLRLPILSGLLSVPPHVAGSADALESLFSSLYGAATYAHKGRVELGAAIVLILGTAIGTRLGATTQAACTPRVYTVLVACLVSCGMALVLSLALPNALATSIPLFLFWGALAVFTLVTGWSALHSASPATNQKGTS